MKGEEVTVGAKGDIDSAVQEQERAALELVYRVKCDYAVDTAITCAFY